VSAKLLSIQSLRALATILVLASPALLCPLAEQTLACIHSTSLVGRSIARYAVVEKPPMARFRRFA